MINSNNLWLIKKNAKQNINVKYEHGVTLNFTVPVVSFYKVDHVIKNLENECGCTGFELVFSGNDLDPNMWLTEDMIANGLTVKFQHNLDTHMKAHVNA